DASRKVESHQRINRLRRRLFDVDQALVRPDLEVLTRVLVDEGGPDDAVDVPLRRQRHRTDDFSAGTRCSLDNRLCRSVELPMLIALEADAYVLLRHPCIPLQSI